MNSRTNIPINDTPADQVTPSPPHPLTPSGNTLAQPPVARCPIEVRAGTLDDLGFIDGLQKMHSHMVGWMPRKQLENYIERGDVLIAESCSPLPVGEGPGVRESGDDCDVENSRCDCKDVPPHPNPLPKGEGTGTPLGYIIFRDQYMKRDDVGIIYQVNVLPLKHRNLIGATLVKAAFEKAAYGCKLFSCWCAQDIQGNWFWEALGFVPLAFRTGSRAKQRIHIFWQRRVRENDDGVGGTDYWFPSQTSGGAVAEDRLVFPIPPGTHWRDAKPVVLPELPQREDEESVDSGGGAPKQLPGGAPVRPRPEQCGGAKLSKAERAALMRSQSQHLKGVPLGKKAVLTASGFKYVERTDYVPTPEEEALFNADGTLKAKKAKKPRPRKKHDPKYLAAARELRDRYLEEMNTGNLLPPAAQGKYDVSRRLDAAPRPLDEPNLLGRSQAA